MDLGLDLPEATGKARSEAYAAFAADRYGWAVDPADVRPVADVVAALTTAIRYVSAPGTPVILPTPAYMPFLTVPGALGREVIQVPLLPGGRYDLDGLDAAFRAGGNLLVLCNPHNPAGRVLTPSGMRDIAAVVERHGGRVLSDEIRAPLVLPGHRHARDVPGLAGLPFPAGPGGPLPPAGRGDDRRCAVRRGRTGLCPVHLRDAAADPARRDRTATGLGRGRRSPS